MGANVKLISIIIPLRLTRGVFEAEERVQLIISSIPADLYEIIVVDYGTPSDKKGVVSEICRKHKHVTLVRVDAETDLFSIGAARDIGVQHARTPMVMFNDIDFFCPTEMYRRVHEEVRSRGMVENIFDFFCVPVMWLTEQATEELHEDLCASKLDRFIYKYHSAALEKNDHVVDTVCYGSSAIVVNKHNYLAIGGHNRRFSGHGAEDYDVLHRLASTWMKGPRTADYYKDTKSNLPVRYEGFRAFFAAYGLDVFQRGIFMVHMWHPTRRMPNYFQSKKNFALLGSLMADFDSTGYQPPPLADKVSSERTLILVDPTSKVANSFRYALPAMGDCTMLAESNFANAQKLISFLKKSSYTRVGFLNPYGNDHRMSLYNGIRDARFPYWTFDRGALPDSWFFDSNGFNADSKSYDRPIWDITLTSDEIRNTEEKCASLRRSDKTLEDNGNRIGADALREMFGLSGQKVIFVPLQRPNDTVIRHFSDPVGSQKEFAKWVNYIAREIDPAEWVIVVKKHPLEQKAPKIGNVFFAPDDTHIHDLLELCDKTLLINSGTGVISMAFNKPVVVCGTAFYNVPGVTYAARTPADALKLAQEDLKFDREKATRFLHHLWNKVYSFATAAYEEIQKEKGAKIKIVKRLLFSEIRGLTRSPLILGEPRKGISLDAPLFSCFGGRAGIKDALKMPSPRPAIMPRKRVNLTPHQSDVSEPVAVMENRKSLPEADNRVEKRSMTLLHPDTDEDTPDKAVNGPLN